MLAFTDFFNIHRLRYFYIIACSIVFAFARVGFAGIRTTAIHFPAAFITLREMLITYRIGTIDHLGGRFSTVLTGRNHFRVNGIYIHCNAVVKYVTFTFKVFSASFFPVFNNTAV